MKSKIITFFSSKRYYLSAFFIPFFIMVFTYAMIGIYWGSDRSVLASDAFSQFSVFHGSFRNMLLGKQSLFYSWSPALGLNYYALVSYYLGGIFTPLVVFFDNSMMPDALYVITLLKIGAAGLTFYAYAKETFHINPWSQVSLSVTYALMSFAIAHSEIIMWLDTFVYLPLVILGINRIFDKKKPTVLFVSYLLLFISNFYMGFMVGLFSFMYFLAQLAIDFKKNKSGIVHYFVTSILAGLASMVMILPAVIDLKANGETLSSITQIKTEATGIWDILIKNMVGVYDGTKYGSVPYIYIGLFPFLLCIFFFVSNRISYKKKFAYWAIFVILILSFYISPLNLFWHGMHSPNMFLFRYAYTFSFLVIMLAGYAWESLSVKELSLFVGTSVILMALFTMAMMVRAEGAYEYVSTEQFLATILFILFYMTTVVLFTLLRGNQKQLAGILLVLMCIEALVNTYDMIDGILDDWNYASRSLYTEPYKKISPIVESINSSHDDTFFRTESLDPATPNDSLNLNYNGISFFSSIRNRHSSGLLDKLGFRSRGTNLNLRYDNNTLMMDALFGVEYNIAKFTPDKYGFKKINTLSTDLDPTVNAHGSYGAYQNSLALPLGMLTNTDIYSVKFPSEDNLGAQTNIYNQLADTKETYYSFVYPTLDSSENVTTNFSGDTLELSETAENLSKILNFSVDIPAGKQAYISIFPTDFGQLESSTATVSVNGVSRKSQIGITGQYYNLGYFNEDTHITFSVNFYGTSEVTILNPPVVLLDKDAFVTSTKSIQEKGVDFVVNKRKASAKVTVEEENLVLFTTIPYDKGWNITVDGKKVEAKPFKSGFITIPLTKGTHSIEMSFLPKGFVLGGILFVVGVGGFVVYRYFLQNKTSDKRVRSKNKRDKQKIQ